MSMPSPLFILLRWGPMNSTRVSRSTLLVALACSLGWSASGCWGRGPSDEAPTSTSAGQPSVGQSSNSSVLTNTRSPRETSTSNATGSEDQTSSADSSNPRPRAPLGYPDIQSCSFPISEPRPGRDGAILVTSTDASTGAIGWINPRTKRIYADLGLAHSDTRIKHSDLHNFVINRFGADSISIFARDEALTLQGEFSVKGPEEGSSNPHDLLLDGRGHLHLSLLGRNHIEVYDISDLKAAKLLREIDLSRFSDADGLPEASSLIQCGDTYFVLIQRLDRESGWAPVDHSYLVPIHAPTGTLYDFDGSGDKQGDGLRILGTGMSSWRKDPRVPDGTRILALNRGLQSVDLRNAVVEELIPQQVFIDRGMDVWDVRSFEISQDGRWVWILAIDGWPKHSLFRASLDGRGQDLTPVVGEIESVGASMIRVGNALWLADTTDGSSGVRVFDIQGDTLVESPDSPLQVGLPPYWLHFSP